MISKLLKKVNQKVLPKNYLYAPEWIVLGVNNVCNLHCKMCDVGTKNLDTNFAVNLVGTHPINMPLELVKKIMDQTAQYYPKAKIGYAFTEPLVYPFLEESLAYAQSLNLYTSITTNALTLPQKAEILVKTGLNDLYISLDGPEEIHNEIRGHKKSFAKALEGIEKIHSFDNPPKVSVFCVITEWNIGYLQEFIAALSHFPLERIGFMHTNFTSEQMADDHNINFSKNYPATVSNMELINLDNMDLDVLWNEISAIKSMDSIFPLSFSPELSSKEELNRFYHSPMTKMGKKCNDIYSNIMIKSDGSVIPAHGRCYNLTIGNINDESLTRIWKSTVLSEFRNTLQKNGGLLPACNRCCSAF
jgi:radical SAM protein with 4Fe4S-binding SPASM domain